VSENDRDGVTEGSSENVDDIVLERDRLRDSENSSDKESDADRVSVTSDVSLGEAVTDADPDREGDPFDLDPVTSLETERVPEKSGLIVAVADGSSEMEGDVALDIVTESDVEKVNVSDGVMNSVSVLDAEALNVCVTEGVLLTEKDDEKDTENVSVTEGSLVME